MALAVRPGSREPVFSMTSFATRSVRLMAAVATGACALVGAHQMRATLLTAVVAVGAFAWVLAVVWLWLGGARGTRLGAGAAPGAPSSAEITREIKAFDTNGRAPS